MALIKGKWIRIECDNILPEQAYHPETTIDLAHQQEPYAELIERAKREGWTIKKGKWYCPYCSVHPKYLISEPVNE